MKFTNYKTRGRLKAARHILKRHALSTGIGKSYWKEIEALRNPVFQWVEIETTSACNRRCGYCPNSSTERPARLMEEGLFYKIIDELSELKFSGRFSPHLYGEPLLDKRIFAFMSYTRKKLPNVYVKFFTNGDLLTHDVFKMLIDSGVDVVRIAQHDPSPSITLKDTLAAIGSRTKKRHIEYVVYYNNDDNLMNRGGLVEVKHDVSMRFCDYVSGISIDYDGNMLLCCQDFMSKYRFGNLKTEKIIDVWNKKNYKELRDNIKSGIWQLDICRICNGLREIRL